MQVIIQRFKGNQQWTLGHCFLKDEQGEVSYIGASLELGWLDNKTDISCIPQGRYPLKYEYSPHFKRYLWEVYNVPNRKEVKFHPANSVSELQGCIALGRHHTPERRLFASAIVIDFLHSKLKGYKSAELIVTSFNVPPEI